MIKKSKGKYLVKDSSGEKTLGKHSSYKKALAQLRAIEASKNEYKNGGKKKEKEMDDNNKKGSLAEAINWGGKNKDKKKKKKSSLAEAFGFKNGGKKEDCGHGKGKGLRDLIKKMKSK